MNQNEVISNTEIRNQLLSLVLADLLGPKEGDEEFVKENKIENRYVLGKLFPKTGGEVDENEDEEDFDLEDSTEEEVGELEKTPNYRGIFPSSVGLSFSVSGMENSFLVSSSWGFYKRESSAEPEGKKGWQRYPFQSVEREIFLREGTISPIQIYEGENNSGAVFYKGIIRKTQEGEWLVSLFLTNELGSARNKSEIVLFQTKMKVYGRENREIFIKKVFQKSEKLGDSDFAKEENYNEMAYIDHREFSVGHNVGTQTHKNNPLSPIAYCIETQFVPFKEIPYYNQSDKSTYPKLHLLSLDMKELYGMPKDKLIGSLKSLPEAYESWLEQELNIFKKRDLKSYDRIAEETYQNCKILQKRLEEGIKIISQDDKALEAFQFSNRAMYIQRIHSIYSEKKRQGSTETLESFDVEKNRSWRIFQLAFLILSIPSLSDLHHEDRVGNTESIADLLWFPTGGGKTEAYMGVTAFSLAMRRLQGNLEGLSGEHGVGVLMRYTLRLLTLQQFQRSTALICACEMIRKENPQKWGKVPFRIGLWVGKKTTPNKTEESKNAINYLSKYNNMSSSSMSSGSPLQLTNCPWCGTLIKPNNYSVESYPKYAGRTFVYCGDPTGNCDFSERKSKGEGIPVVVVDEEIYRLLPSLVIATVDKFAQISREGQVQMLFGRVDRYCERHGFSSSGTDESDSHVAFSGSPSTKTKTHTYLRPPDLIIQDELHLISGPLGSLVGLYETAIDELCKWSYKGKTIKPKIIASTATIRMAKEQIWRLYTRKAMIFPSPGLRVEDNFFLQQVPPTDLNPGRLYIGINSIGERVKILMIRVYLAFLAASKTLFEKYHKPADPYMTLVGYFNSLRELGGMRRLVEDDVSSRLYYIHNRGLSQRSNPRIEELTSRKSTYDIPTILDSLESTYPITEEDKKNKKYYDVLLATNMISVGVDVKRFGLMVVAGQPKTTSEYIQATSRIGRSFPGIVCTVYNWTRPRDISHYERFEYYHETFYRQVEVNSITPFSRRALDRALNGIFVGLIRLLKREYNPNPSAHNFNRDSELVINTINIIKERAKLVNPGMGEEIEKMIDDRIKKWEKRITFSKDNGNKLVFIEGSKDPNLLVRITAKNKNTHLHVLNSLRDVESSVNFYLEN